YRRRLRKTASCVYRPILHRSHYPAVAEVPGPAENCRGSGIGGGLVGKRSWQFFATAAGSRDGEFRGRTVDGYVIGHRDRWALVQIIDSEGDRMNAVRREARVEGGTGGWGVCRESVYLPDIGADQR